MWLLLAEMVAAGGAVVAVVGHAAWDAIRVRRHRDAIAAAERHLRRAIREDASVETAAASLGQLPRQVAIDLVAALAGALAGRYHARLREVAAAAGLLMWAEQGLQSPRWASRLQAVRLLTLLGAPSDPASAVLDDEHPAVRAQAIEWAGGSSDPAMIERLVRQLDDPDRVSRVAVHDALVRTGQRVVEPLAEYLERVAAPEHAVAALAVADELVAPAFLPAARRLSGHDDPEVRAAAARVLASVGGEEAVTRLTLLLDDPAADVRAVAASGLGSLSAWTAAPALGRAVADRSWLVRRNAALALRRLGGPGYVVLRRCRRDRDPFAADMARHVLDLPADGHLP